LARRSYLFFRRKIPGEEPLFIPPMDETTFIDPDFDFHFVLKDKFQDAVLKTKEHCVRTERFKYVRTPGVRHSIERLFDLRDDPHCEKDIKKQYPEVKARLAAALDQLAHHASAEHHAGDLRHPWRGEPSSLPPRRERR
jgi:hypothetical protein